MSKSIYTSMKRPKPTKQLIIELCGENQGLIEALHHGLYETSLANIYPHLDLDEAAAFAASSWKTRDKSPYFFEHDITPTTNLHDIFSQVYIIGFSWLNKNKEISDRLRPLHEKLNPYKGKDLRARLQRADSDTVEKLKKGLKETVNEYVFECQYQDKKMQRDGDNYKLVPMRFQAVYPRKGKIVPAYGSEIARLISKYSTEYHPHGQISLF